MKKVLLFSTLALVVLFFACQKDVVSSVFPSNNAKNFMTVQKAKDWFDENEPKTVWTKTEKQEHYKPQWNSALQLNGAVEVPVLLENKVIKPTINSNNLKLEGVTRLLVASLDGHTIDAAIIKYFPSEKFVGNIQEINRDNFREKKFDGMIKLENFDFTDQVVLLIEKGELKYFMGKNIQYNPDREDYQVCYQNCTTWYGTNYSGGNPYSYTETNCSGYYCVIVPTGSTGSTDPNQNNAGGVTSGTNSSGAGILGGTPITTTNKLCAESLSELKTIETLNRGVYQTSGLINVNIELIRPLMSNTFNLNFPYLIFDITRGSDPIPPAIPDANIKIVNAFNQAVTDTQRDIMLFNDPPIYTKEDAKERFLSYLSIHLTGNLSTLSSAYNLDVNPNIAALFGGDRIPLSSVQTQNTSTPDAPCKK